MEVIDVEVLGAIWFSVRVRPPRQFPQILLKDTSDDNKVGDPWMLNLPE